MPQLLPLSIRYGSPSHPRRPRHAAGFTLVELLAVIAIIGILAGIIIPVVGSVRARSKTTGCTSNLRQIGMGMLLYAQDNKARFPKVYGRDGLTPSTTWMQKTAAYVGLDNVLGTAAEGKPRAAGLFLCPEFTYDSGTRNVPYALNVYIDPSTGSTWDYQTRIPAPNRTFLIVETNFNGETHSPGSGGDVTRRHPNQGANFLFADGHVETISTPVPVTDERWRAQL
ncbi:MAG: prepilin-type N-terminal cleavage/methylation domain-containing protein [Opitutaceae bacterium]|jgi:prepilin-type processing-associated H-X9-DG protein/prepilin-type N-terminal cleavage/methylation domain-containing protein